MSATTKNVIVITNDVQRIAQCSYATTCTVNGKKKCVSLTQQKQDPVQSGAAGAATLSRMPPNSEGLSSIQGQFMWGLWRTKRQCDRPVSEYFSSLPSVSSSDAPHRISFIYHRRYTILVNDSILKCNISLFVKERPKFRDIKTGINTLNSGREAETKIKE